MSKCNICGADLAPGAKFCTGCGTPVPQDLNPAPAAPASTAFQQAVSSSAGNPTAFEQAVSSNNAPKNIYSDVPQYGQPDAGTSQPVGASLVSMVSHLLVVSLISMASNLSVVSLILMVSSLSVVSLILVVSSLLVVSQAQIHFIMDSRRCSLKRKKQALSLES